MFIHSFVHWFNIYEALFKHWVCKSEKRHSPGLFLPSLWGLVLIASVLYLLHWPHPPRECHMLTALLPTWPSLVSGDLPLQPRLIGPGLGTSPRIDIQLADPSCGLPGKSEPHQSDPCSCKFELGNIEWWRQSRGTSYRADWLDVESGP